MECRKQKSREWQVRLSEDIKTNTNGKFITLTFNNKEYTKLWHEVSRKGYKGYELDNEIATLAVRRFLERWRKEYKKSIRHWLITELGHQGTEHLHLHGIIWTDEKLDKVEEIWKYGFMWKGEGDKKFIELGVPTTFLRASFYWDNFIYFGAGPKKGPDGKYYLTFPLDDKKMGGIAAEDIGKCAYGIFKKGKELIGKTVGIAGEHLTGQEMADAMSKAIGQEIIYNNVTPETYRGFGFPGADDLGNMFQFYRDFETDVNGIRDVSVSKQLNPELKNFDQWLSENAKKIPLD